MNETQTTMKTIRTSQTKAPKFPKRIAILDTGKAWRIVKRSINFVRGRDITTWWTVLETPNGDAIEKEWKRIADPKFKNNW